MWIVDNGVLLPMRTVDPVEDFGIMQHPLDDVCGGGAQERIDVFNAILRNEATSSDGNKKYYGTLEINAVRDFILINSAVGLYAVGLCQSLKEGVHMARKAIENGSAARTMEQFVSLTKSL